jgi:uncharacterized membrane protein
MQLAGFPLSERWLHWPIALYAVVMACRMRVVWLRMRLRDIAAQAQRDGCCCPAAIRAASAVICIRGAGAVRVPLHL